jgi:hypothetical protein
MTRKIRVSLALAGAALLVPVASAQEFGSRSARNSEKNCTSAGAGGVTIGYQTGSGLDQSSKLQQYETVPKGALLSCATYGWKNDKNYFADVTGTKLGLDDQFASLVAGKTDSFKLLLSWDQNPNWQSNTARTPYTETSAGVFHVPDGMRKSLQNVYVPWVPPTSSNPIGTGSAPANPTVPGFYAVQPWVNDSQPIDLLYLRRTGRSALSFKSGKNWNFNLSYARELRDGNKNTTFYGGPSYEVATPLKYTTDDFRAEAEFAKGKWFANAAVNFNKFTNDILYNTIDNPERLELQSPTSGRFVINDATTFRLWQPPSNDMYTIDGTAGVKLGKKHKLTGTFQTGSMKMDHELIDISTNPYLATSATAPDPNFTVRPPYPGVEARFDNLMAQFKLTGDPSTKFGYIASYRRYELEDKTDDYHFTSSVRGDVGPSYSAAGFTREHEGWSVESLKGEVHVRPTGGLRLSASYGQDKKTYDAREYSDVTDKNLSFTVDYAYKWASFHGLWTVLDRKPGDTNVDAIQPTWQGATQTDITERNRHMLSGFLTLTSAKGLAVTFTGNKTSNEFAESVTGLLDQSFDSIGADLSYAPNEKLNLYGGYVYEKYFFKMDAAYIPRGTNPPYDPANLWENDTTDKIDTFRAGFAWTIRPERWDASADIDYSKPRSESLYNFALPGTPIGGLNEANGIFPANVPPIPGFPVVSYDRFPLVTKKFTIAKIRLNYHVDKRLTLSAMYWKQKYDNTDWQTNNPGANGEPFTPYMGRIDPSANRWFFLGAQVPGYDANIFRASLTYTF